MERNTICCRTDINVRLSDCWSILLIDMLTSRQVKSRAIVHRVCDYRIRKVITYTGLSCQCFKDCSCNEDFVKENNIKDEVWYHLSHPDENTKKFKKLKDAVNAIPDDINWANYKLTFGKYRGWLLGAVNKANPSYIKWLNKENVLKGKIFF